MKIEEVNLKDISIDKTQPRKSFPSSAINELVSSILKRGLLEPLKVIKLNKGYMLIDGERRFKALNILVKYGDKDSKIVNCIVIDKLKEKTLTQLTYDIQKEKIPYLEEGEAYKKLIEEEDYSVEDIAMALGKRKQYILGRLKLTSFNENTKELIRSGKIPVQALSAIDINKSKEAEDRIINRIIKEKPSYGESRIILQEETKDKKGLLNLFLRDVINFKLKCLRFENKYLPLLNKPDIDFFKNQEVGDVITELEKLENNLERLDKIKKEVKSVKRILNEMAYNFGEEKELNNKDIDKLKNKTNKR